MAKLKDLDWKNRWIRKTFWKKELRIKFFDGYWSYYPGNKYSSYFMEQDDAEGDNWEYYEEKPKVFYRHYYTYPTEPNIIRTFTTFDPWDTYFKSCTQHYLPTLVKTEIMETDQ